MVGTISILIYLILRWMTLWVLYNVKSYYLSHIHMHNNIVRDLIRPKSCPSLYAWPILFRPPIISCTYTTYLIRFLNSKLYLLFVPIKCFVWSLRENTAKGTILGCRGKTGINSTRTWCPRERSQPQWYSGKNLKYLIVNVYILCRFQISYNNNI